MAPTIVVGCSAGGSAKPSIGGIGNAQAFELEAGDNQQARTSRNSAESILVRRSSVATRSRVAGLAPIVTTKRDDVAQATTDPAQRRGTRDLQRRVISPGDHAEPIRVGVLALAERCVIPSYASASLRLQNVRRRGTAGIVCHRAGLPATDGVHVASHGLSLVLAWRAPRRLETMAHAKRKPPQRSAPCTRDGSGCTSVLRIGGRRICDARGRYYLQRARGARCRRGPATAECAQLERSERQCGHVRAPSRGR